MFVTALCFLFLINNFYLVNSGCYFLSFAIFLGHVTGKEMPTSPQYMDIFAISDYGVITAIGDLDRETKANYSFEVRAMDLDPDYPRYNLTAVDIKVLDINDNPPVFRQASYVADLLEHSDVGFVPLQVNIVVNK